MKRLIYVSYAPEDEMLLKEIERYFRNEEVRFELISMKTNNPWDTDWQTDCKNRINSCHGFLIIVSKNTKRDLSQKLELKYASEGRKKIKAVYGNNKPLLLSSKLSGLNIVEWNLEKIEKMLAEL